MKNSLFLLAFLIISLSASGLSAKDAQPPAKEEAWDVIPEGAKLSYMGIHGGTMPVSLLVSGDGSSLLSFVGRTGNDFVETLRNAHLPLPSFGNSTRIAPARPNANPGIFAGNATASMPVFAVGGLPGRMDAISGLVPFGLSQEPLSIEGPVAKPKHFPHARAIRAFRLPDYFRPRRR